MTTKQTPDFRGSMPSAARDKILELQQREDSTPEELAALDRLATYEVMRTEVWQRLPPSAAGMEGQIILWTVVGLRLAAAIQPPFPKNKAEFAEHLAKYPPRWTAQNAATAARTLVEAMDENRRDAEGIWEEYWQTMWRGQTLSRWRQPCVGSRPIDIRATSASRFYTYLEARNFVEWLTDFFEVMWAEEQAIADALKLPTIRKKRAGNAKELYLSQFLSQRFLDQFHEPFDPIVSALVGVALDSDLGPDAVIIRGRRRPQRKISSKK